MRKSRGDDVLEICSATGAVQWEQNGASVKPSALSATGILLPIRDDFSATFQFPIFTKFCHNTSIHVLSKRIGKYFLKIFSLGVICPKNSKLKGIKQAPFSDRFSAHGTHYKETLITL